MGSFSRSIQQSSQLNHRRECRVSRRRVSLPRWVQAQRRSLGCKTDIGVWDHLDLSRTRGIEEMQVWDGLSSARITFSSPTIEPSPFAPTSAAGSPPRVEPMATLVENLNLQRGSLRFLEKAQGVELLDGRKVLGVTPDEGGWPVVEVEGKEGAGSRSLRARLLVCLVCRCEGGEGADFHLCRSEPMVSTVPSRRTQRLRRSAGPTTLTASLPVSRSPPKPWAKA
jgi:hypothetical protein